MLVVGLGSSESTVRWVEGWADLGQWVSGYVDMVLVLGSHVGAGTNISSVISQASPGGDIAGYWILG